jgi:hypothetical protein
MCITKTRDFAPNKELEIDFTRPDSINISLLTERKQRWPSAAIDVIRGSPPLLPYAA